MRKSLLAFSLLISVFLLPESKAQDTTSKGIVVTQAPKIIVILNAVKHNLCNGDRKGAINIMAMGGFPPYKYHWSTGDTTQDVAGLEAGDYWVAVSDNFSCSDTMHITINEPPKIEIAVDSIRDVLCYGQNKGEVNITVTGGRQPYSYAWNNGSTSEDIKNATSGSYSVLITDANNCQEIAVAEIKDRPLIVRRIKDKRDIKCYGDSTGLVDMEVSGGIPPYQYFWDSGDSTQDLRNVVAGVYEVTVVDDAGCTEITTTKVEEPDKLEINVDKIAKISCNGDQSGAINISVLGGAVPYQYEWSNGATDQDIAGLPAGKYNLTLTDANGCTENYSTELTEPPALEIQLVELNNVQFFGGNNGSINIGVTGGVSPYKYSWSNGATTQDISELDAGSYTVRVTDATGCVKTTTLTITQPEKMVVELISTVDVKCYGDKSGRVDIKVTGGVTPYSFKWNNGAETEDLAEVGAGTYEVVVTDANNFKKTLKAEVKQPENFVASVASIKDIDCFGDYTGAIDINVNGGVEPYRYKWNNGLITQDVSNLRAGKYSVSIQDKNGCTKSLEAEVKQSPDLNVKLEKLENIKCYGDKKGQVNITVTGGTPPYDYVWNNGAKTQDIVNLEIGKYNVQVKDSKGCTKKLETRIVQPSELVVEKEGQKDVDCNGNATGAIKIRVRGGTMPYSYSWSNEATTEDVSGLKAGSYSVKVADNNGCTKALSATITEPTKLVRTIDKVTNVDCYGEAKGGIDISVIGGTPPYRYSWSNGVTSQDLNYVKAGAYSVKILDSKSCPAEASATIKENTELIAAVESTTDVKCFGLKKGAINISVKGGIEPYKYKWSNGLTTQDIAGVEAGNYSVKVSDAKGCVKHVSSTIKQPQKLLTEIAQENDIKCYGVNSGAIKVNVRGGVEPYSFNWSNGQTTKDLTALSTGTYKLVTTDANGCTSTLSTEITQPSKLYSKVLSIHNVECYGDKVGTIDISVIGGVPPYTYSWNNGATTQDIANAPAGQYKVKIREGNGCENELSAEIKQPDELKVTLDEVTHVKCYGNKTGAINISVTGGKAPYKYSWSDGYVTEDISGVEAGNYSVTVSDANGCTKTISTNIKQPPLMEAKVMEVKHIACYGAKEGVIQVSLKGGVAPYKFEWSTGDTTRNLMNAPAGTHTLTITDANGCTEKVTETIRQPEKLVAKLANVKNVKCNNEKTGVVNITVVGGTPPYSYLWNNQAQVQDLIGVAAGKYKVQVKDNRGCSVDAIEAEVTQPGALNVSVSKVTNVLTYGKSTGAINIDVSGGVSPYSYSWSNGQKEQDLTGIVAGNYSVIVTDANGCVKTVSANVTQPPALEAKITNITDIKCAGNKTGAINLAVKGGKQPYTYAWSNGSSTMNLSGIGAGTYTVTIKDANGYTKKLTANVNEPKSFVTKIDELNHLNCFKDGKGSISILTTGGTPPYKYSWNTGATTQDIQNLQAGNYSVQVMDANGCMNKLSAEVKQPDDLVGSVDNISHVKCNDESTGEVKISVKGGVSPYKYHWSNGAITQNISSVKAGAYSVQITDKNGCYKNVTANIKQPTALRTEVASVKNNNCNGEKNGAIALSVTGGTVPYQFTWSNGDSVKNVSSLAAGKYSVAIKDANGCSSNLAAEITQPPVLKAAIAEVQNIKCFGENEGSAQLEVSGGAGVYKYSWSNGNTTKDLENAPAGNYSVTVSDAKGCNASLDVTLEQPERLVLQLDTVIHANCYAENKGQVNISVSGGVEPYRFDWSNGEVTEDLRDVPAGTYSVKVKDANGCLENITTNVNQPSELVARVDNVSGVQCYGDSTGRVDISVSGGREPYRYSWSNGATTQDLVDVKPGKYSVEVIDANNCVSTASGEVSQPRKLITKVDHITDVRCFGNATGEVGVSVMEGTPPYKFSWSNGATTEDLKEIKAGEYLLTVTESNGCVTKIDAVVKEPQVFTASIDNVTHINCHGDETGAIDISVSGGVEPYTYFWSDGSKEEDLKNVPSDQYLVTVTDANGCRNNLTAKLKEPTPLEIVIDSVYNVKCCGDESGAIFISVKGGVKPYKYEWSNGEISQDITNLPQGRYTVVVTDANGCQISTPEDGMNLYEKLLTQGKFVSHDILFDVASAKIKRESFGPINKIASMLKEHPDLRLRIEGHTDSDGSAESNVKLSQDRANSIKEALIRFGIRESRLETKGWGEEKPVDTNATRQGKANNRRVEFLAI